MGGIEDVEAAVFDAVRYFRYRGAKLEEVDRYAGHRVEGYSTSARTKALMALERASRIEQRGEKWFIAASLMRTALGNSYAPEFERSDIVLLMAIVGSRKPQPLSKVVAAFDFINRLIPSFDEIYGGLNRLKSAKLISRRAARFLATQKGEKLWAKAKKHSRSSMPDQSEVLERLMLCPCCGVSLRRVGWSLRLEEEEYEEAVREYQRAFAEAVASKTRSHDAK